MKIITDSGILDFEPAFSLEVTEEVDSRGGWKYYSVVDDQVSYVKRIAISDILDGYFWFFASQIEVVRNRLAAKGIGLRIIEEE